MATNIRVDDETHRRLVKLADGRPLGRVIKHLTERAEPLPEITKLMVPSEAVSPR